MVDDASGCWARAVRAVATDRPSPSAGAMQPMAVVMPAVAIEVTAIRVILSITIPWSFPVGVLTRRHRFRFACTRGGGDVDRGQDAEDVRLHHAREQS